jgi:hypothetical protein
MRLQPKFVVNQVGIDLRLSDLTQTTAELALHLH